MRTIRKDFLAIISIGKEEFVYKTFRYDIMTKLKDPIALRNQVLNWLESLRIKDAKYGTYKMSKSTDATLFSSCFAVFVRELYDDLRNITQPQRQEWIDLINNSQDEKTGSFTEKRLKNQGLFSTELGKDHDAGYVTWQLTTFCISALKALGGKIRYSFKFSNEWKNPDKIKSWLRNLDWKNDTWTAGNIAMFLGICLITDYEKNDNKRAKEALDAFFSWHDDFQDPKTGFWGTNHGAPIQIGLFGAMHQYLLYYHMDKSLKHMEKIIDYTLLFQERDGHFFPGSGGGGCEDYDAIDTLVNMYKRTDYRRNDIKQALQKALIATINTQGNDGGFLWARRKKFGVVDWFRQGFSFTRHWNFRYWKWSCRKAVGVQLRRNQPRLSMGWTDTGIPVDESDIFATWFRSLNLAEISEVIPDNPYAKIDWRFLEAPGLGWHK